MKPAEFVTKYLAFALATEKKTGISALVIMAQSALETGWGAACPGNMMFGVKDFDGLNGNEQLIKTFEFNKNPNLSPVQIGLNSIDKVELDAVQSKAAKMPMYKYTGKAYFQKYNTPEESFTEHATLFKQKNFAPAMAVKDKPEEFVRKMAPVYAQSATYADTIIIIMRQIERIIKK